MVDLEALRAAQLRSRKGPTVGVTPRSLQQVADELVVGRAAIEALAVQNAAKQAA